MKILFAFATLLSAVVAASDLHHVREQLIEVVLGGEGQDFHYVLVSDPDNVCKSSLEFQITGEGYVYIPTLTHYSVGFQLADVNTGRAVSKKSEYSSRDYVYLDDEALTVQRRGLRYRHIDMRMDGLGAAVAIPYGKFHENIRMEHTGDELQISWKGYVSTSVCRYKNLK